MEINEKTIDHLSHLCKLRFEGEEKVAIKNDLERILQFMGKLNEVPTDNVAPLIFMSNEENVLREDIPAITVSQSEALQNAARKDSDYFRIAKVLNK
jgi:aspartyl-tRNA(Asn)/glutamyl-tRNA(Gln) amidotransferase subunit C